LEKVKAGLSKKGCTKKYDKVCEKLGRLKEKYSKVARFMVTDTGMGIADSDRAKIFNAFERLERSHQSNIHGLGMGLHIVKKHLDVLGGKIDFESVLNHGSKFWVDIPLRKILS
ncbi:sensor histidine kinase, partial [Cysteiniphilum marinum]|uniref:sensor histidine kinase n=1 Tax=Cysteiniphilum marinum TaxID=2774191 RepID=UPI001F1D081B